MFNDIKFFIYKHKKIFSILSLIAILFASFTMPAYADTGNFSRSASSHSSSSSSSSGNGWLIYLFIDLFIHHPLFTIIAVIIGFFLYRKFKSNGTLDAVANTYNTVKNSDSILDKNNEQIVLEKITALDSNFDVNKFKARTSNMFMSLQEAWEKKDWKIVRPYESDNLFSMHSQQLQEYINKNQTNMMESICVKSITLKDFYTNQNTMVDNIEVILEASFIDYVKDDRTGKIITGDSTRPIFMRYKWTLIRKSGVKSKIDNNGISSTSCPNCGAPVSIGASGECEYCHSVVTSGDYDWVLTSIEA